MITISKVQEICKLIPSLEKEINWDRGVSTKSKDNVKYVFKNGSELDILAARESSRGQRRNGGVIEEVSNIALIHSFPVYQQGLQKCS